MASAHVLSYQELHTHTNLLSGSMSRTGVHVSPQSIDLERGKHSFSNSGMASETEKSLLLKSIGTSAALARAFGSKEIFAGCCYCIISLSMVLMNKAVLSSFDFHAPNSLLFFQCCMSVGLICLFRWMKWVSQEPLEMRVARIWCPANMLFVAMVWSGFHSLKNLSVPMVTVLKNSTNFLVLIGDWVVFRKQYGLGVWAAVCLIVMSSVLGGLTDLSFSWKGYMWQGFNCVCSASYSLYLKVAMEQLAVLTGNPKGLEESTMVLYNNLLALPWVFMIMIMFGETNTILQEPALYDPKFILASILSGILAFSISFASLFFLSNTTASTYNLTGSLNKVPMTILGMIFFDTPMTHLNILSLAVGLFAGIMFVFAKSKKKG